MPIEVTRAMEHKTVSLADQVFDRLENEILCGNYARGEVLTELKLVEDLGVSRTPIREAIRRLEQEHIVDVSQKGIVVLGVTQDDLADMYQIRLRIEGLATAYAAERITPEQLTELKETIDLQDFYANRSDADNIKTLDSHFHERIFKFSGSNVLYYELEPLHKKMQKYRRVSLEDSGRAARSIAEHRHIYEAIAAGDAKRAERAAVTHVKNAMEHILRG